MGTRMSFGVVIALASACGHGPPPASAPSFASYCAYDAGVPDDTQLPSGWPTSCDGVGECVPEGDHSWVATYAHGVCASGHCVLDDPPTWTYCEHGCVNSGTSYVRCAHAGPTAP